MADNKQATILVKKADGTKVRVTLEEFKKMREGEKGNGETSQTSGKSGMSDNEQNVMNNELITPLENNIQEEKMFVTSASVPLSPAVTLLENEQVLAKEQNDVPVAEENELATTTPVTDIFVNEAAANFEWGQKDNESLLEEDNKEVVALQNKGKVHVAMHDLNEHIKMPSMGIDDDMKNRAKSLLISWQKGIRNDYQILDYAKRDINHGGLGLDDDQANRFLNQIKNYKNNLDNLFEIVFEKKKQQVILNTNTKNVVDATSKNEVLNINPENFRKEIAKNTITDDNFFSAPFSHTPPKSVVYDVASPQSLKQKTTGPKQEISEFSLVEFRRFAKDPYKCADMLFSKFQSWKQESYLLFLDTMEGWHLSPLYNMYVRATLEAFNKHITLQQFFQTKNPNDFITFEEYKSLIELNDKLSK
ncbi:MAG: hypothetical protein WC070_04825 [Candidatus Magasanikbacteria bacterium]